MGRLLPRGRADLVLQGLVFIGGLLGYELVRGLVATTGSTPFANAHRIVSLERSLHVFAEPAIETWAQHHAEPLLDAAAWIYLNAHPVVTVAVLAFLYARHRREFGRARDTLLIAMLIALAGYALFPTAPPRLLPGLGFTDPVRRLTGLSTSHGAAGVLVNPYAAIPSMHVCFAVVLGGSMARLARRPGIRILWLAYPLLIAAVVIITANHLFTDVVLGVATAAAAGLPAARRHRPPAGHRAAPAAGAPALDGLPA